jgi:hypothetical protein
MIKGGRLFGYGRKFGFQNFLQKSPKPNKHPGALDWHFTVNKISDGHDLFAASFRVFLRSRNEKKCNCAIKITRVRT